ncbi:hypothetical protein D3C71_971010 [compost metagenome]
MHDDVVQAVVGTTNDTFHNLHVLVKTELTSENIPGAILEVTHAQVYANAVQVEHGVGIDVLLVLVLELEEHPQAFLDVLEFFGKPRTIFVADR